VAVVYGLRDNFACRHCYRLAYESQQEPIRMRNQTFLIPFRKGRRICISVPYERPCRAYEIAKDRSIQGVMDRASVVVTLKYIQVSVPKKYI
jgi:hypothetical protein